jgi:predicted enzyme related to lactoylglutathione lyase
MLSIPGGCVVELIDRHGSARRMKGASAAVNHLAFDVDDVEASEAVLRKRGVDIVAPCTILEEFNTKVVKCRDPNGVVIAFRKNLR